MYQPIDVTFVDPRSFDGDCYDVAKRAVQQLEGIYREVLNPAVESTMLMARNAYMERNIAMGNPPAGDAYLATAEGKKFVAIEAARVDALRALRLLKQAVAFDPKHPPRV